jgi:hypothetical protein
MLSRAEGAGGGIDLDLATSKREEVARKPISLATVVPRLCGIPIKNSRRWSKKVSPFATRSKTKARLRKYFLISYGLSRHSKIAKLYLVDTRIMLCRYDFWHCYPEWQDFLAPASTLPKAPLASAH